MDIKSAFGVPPVTGRIRAVPEHFIVEEQLGFQPGGAGEHYWLWVEKRGANTEWVARQLARFAAVAPMEVGFSGLKDRHAVTRQWFSVKYPIKQDLDWSQCVIEGVTVLEVCRYDKKLKRGWHRSNRFEITVTGLQGDFGALEQRLQQCSARGVPNYFGEQRFGFNNLDPANFTQAKSRNRSKRNPAAGMHISAARAYLFNTVLSQRVGEGSWARLESGDIAFLDGSNSQFAVESVDSDLNARADMLDVHPSGPMWGRGELKTQHRIRDLEMAAAESLSVYTQFLETVGLSQERRSLRLAVKDFSWEINGDSLCLRFALTRGCYATSVLRELISYDVAGFSEELDS